MTVIVLLLKVLLSVFFNVSFHFEQTNVLLALLLPRIYLSMWEILLLNRQLEIRDQPREIQAAEITAAYL